MSLPPRPTETAIKVLFVVVRVTLVCL